MMRIRTSVICLEHDRVLVFKAVDPTSQKQFLFLPGGKIEANETAEQAAIRETLEETGFTIELIPNTQQTTRYWFEWDGGHHDCLTYFYNAKLVNPHDAPLVVNDADYNKGACWIFASECQQAFSYHPTIQNAVMQALKHAGIYK